MRRDKGRSKEKNIKKLQNQVQAKNDKLIKARKLLRLFIMPLLITTLTIFFALIIKAFANENEAIKAGKEILSAIQSREKQNNDIKLKDYQKPINQDIANWTRGLESQLNQDAKKTKAIVEPKFKPTKENQALANELHEKSQFVMNEALGVTVSDNKNQNIQGTDFLIFASFSMGEKNLGNLIKLASYYRPISRILVIIPYSVLYE